MKRTVKKVEGRHGSHDIIIEEFNSYYELIQTNDSRHCNFGNARKGDKSWAGASYEEAVEMLLYGWQDDEKVKVITDKVSKLAKQHDVMKMSFKNDIVGYAPIVPLALKGVPQSMINCTRKPKKSKVINLVVDVTVSCGTSVKEILNWGAEVVSKIMSLEKQGFRVRIEVVTTYASDNWRRKAHAMKVLIKGENQPFDIKRLMFPIAHSAMLRKIGFDWYERLPEAEEISGYGCSLIHHTSDHATAMKKAIADTDSSYYICNKEDINKVLKEVA